MRFPRRSAVAALTVALVLAVWQVTGSEEGAGMKRGDVGLASIGALAFAPDGTLFIADPEAAAVYAVDVGAGTGEASGGSLATVEDLDGKIAALLGVGVRDVFIRDMAVHGDSRTAYLSITRGSGEGAIPVLMKVVPGGDIARVPLDAVLHSKVVLADAPDPEAQAFRRRQRTLTVTDMELIGGELYVAGLSNEEFASTLRRIPYPFRGEVSTTGLEIYHGAHGEYETHAPIFTFAPYEIGGEPHILASYLCTPLVSFPVEELRSQEKLRGKTLAELGWGNIPIDMLPYEAGGERYLLVTNNRRGTMKISGADIEAAQKRAGITSEVGPRAGVDYESSPLGHVVQIDELDAERFLILGRSPENGSLYLQARPKVRL